MVEGVFVSIKMERLSMTGDQSRLEWRRALRKFKQGLRVRAKIGAFDAICEEIRSERATKKWQQPTWRDERWIKFLADSIKQQDYSHTLIKGLIQTAEVNLFWKNVPLPSFAIDAANYVCKQYSKDLRKHFGVIDEIKK